MYEELEKINERPEPFEIYTADDLWTEEHTSKKMLGFHLDGDGDYSSRNREFIKRSVNWIAEYFEIGKGKSIADFGCGPGLYATPLAEAGGKVTGIDFSTSSLEYARKVASENGLDIEYIHRNYLQFVTDKKFDLIIMIMCDYCALSPPQRSNLLKVFFNCLADDGAVLLDAYSLNAFEQRKEGASYDFNQLNGFWSDDDYYGFLNTFKYENKKVCLDKWTIVEKARVRTVYNWLQYFSQEAIRLEFEENGMNIEEFYSDVAGSPFDPESPEFAIVAKKR